MTDREQIYDLMVRYSQSIDAGDSASALRCFTEDAVVQFDPPGGQGKQLLARDMYVRNDEPRSRGFHLNGNFTFDLHGNEASFSCLMLAQHWRIDTDFSNEKTLFSLAGRYDNKVIRTEDGWRIADLHVTTFWLSGDPEIVSVPQLDDSGEDAI